MIPIHDADFFMRSIKGRMKTSDVRKPIVVGFTALLCVFIPFPLFSGHIFIALCFRVCHFVIVPHSFILASPVPPTSIASLCTSLNISQFSKRFSHRIILSSYLVHFLSFSYFFKFIFSFLFRYPSFSHFCFTSLYSLIFTSVPFIPSSSLHFSFPQFASLPSFPHFCFAFLYSLSLLYFPWFPNFISLSLIPSFLRHILHSLILLHFPSSPHFCFPSPHSATLPCQFQRAGIYLTMIAEVYRSAVDCRQDIEALDANWCSYLAL